MIVRLGRNTSISNNGAVICGESVIAAPNELIVSDDKQEISKYCREHEPSHVIHDTDNPIKLKSGMAVRVL